MWVLAVFIKIRILDLNSSLANNENTKEDCITDFNMDEPQYNRHQIKSYLQTKNAIINNNNNKAASGSFMENTNNNSFKRITENCTSNNNNPYPDDSNNKKEEFCQLLEKFQSTFHSFITEFLESQIVNPSTSTTLRSNVPKKYNLKIKIKLMNHILTKFEPGVRKLLQEEVLSTMCHLSPCNPKRMHKVRDGYSSSSNPSDVLLSFLEDNLKYLDNLINKLKCQHEQSDSSSRVAYDVKQLEEVQRPNSPRVIPLVHYQNVINQIFEKPFDQNDPVFKHEARPIDCVGKKRQSSFYLGPCKSCKSDTELRLGGSIFTGLYNVPTNPDARKIFDCKIAQHLKSTKGPNPFHLRPATAAVSSYKKMRQHELSTFQSFEDSLLSYTRMSKCVPVLWCGRGPDGKELLYPSSDVNFSGNPDFSWKNSCCGSFTSATMNPSELLQNQSAWGDYGNNMGGSPRTKYGRRNRGNKYDGYSSSDKGSKSPRKNKKYPKKLRKKTRRKQNKTSDDEDEYTGDDSESDYRDKSRKKDKNRKKKLKYDDDEDSNYDDHEKNKLQKNKIKKPKSKLSSRPSLHKVGAGLKYAKSRDGDDDNDDNTKQKGGKRNNKNDSANQTDDSDGSNGRKGGNRGKRSKTQVKGPGKQNKGTGNDSKRNKNQATGTDSRTKVSGNQTPKIDKQSKGVGKENNTQGKGIQTKGIGNKVRGNQTKKGESSSYDEDFDDGKIPRKTQMTNTSPSRTQNKQKGEKSTNTSNKPSRQNFRTQSTKGTSIDPNNRPGTSSSKGTSMEPRGKKSRNAFYPPGSSGKSSRGNISSRKNSRGTLTEPKKPGINRGTQAIAPMSTSPDRRHGKHHGASRSTSTRNLQKHRSRGTSPDYKLAAEKNIAGKNQGTNTQRSQTHSSSTQPKSRHSIRVGSIECSESDFENLKPSRSNKSSHRAFTSRSTRLASSTKQNIHYPTKRNEATQSYNNDNNYKNRTSTQQQQSQHQRDGRKLPPLYGKRSLSRGDTSSRRNFPGYTNKSTTVVDSRLPYITRDKSQGKQPGQQNLRQHRNVGSGESTIQNRGSKSKQFSNKSSSRINSNRYNQSVQSSRRGRSLSRNYMSLSTARRKSQQYRNVSSRYNISNNNNSKYSKRGKSETQINNNNRKEEPYYKNKLSQMRLNPTYSSTVRSFAHSFANLDKKRPSIFEEEPAEIPIDLTCPQETFFWVPLGRYSWEMKRIKVCKTIKDPREDLGSKQYMYMYPNTKIKTNPMELCSSPCCVSDAENDNISNFCDTITCKHAESNCSCLFECPSQLL